MVNFSDISKKAMDYERFGISREESLGLLNEYISNRNMIKHCLATEAIMRSLATRLNADEDQWGLAGLLHDLDVETHPDLSVHTQETIKILSEKGADPDIIDAIRMHNEKAHDAKRHTIFHHALAAGETITGLVIATALVYPDKKLGSVKPKSVRKRFKEKAFARGADREIIKECEHLGLEINEFCDLALAAMQALPMIWKCRSVCQKMFLLKETSLTAIDMRRQQYESNSKLCSGL